MTADEPRRRVRLRPASEIPMRPTPISPAERVELNRKAKAFRLAMRARRVR